MPDVSFPTVIRVAGQPYRVEVIHPAEGMFRGAPHNAVGSSDHDRQIIRVRGPEELSVHQAVETVLHETLHAIFYLYDFTRLVKGGNEERLISPLSVALMATLRDNPALVATIMRDLGDNTLEDHDHGTD